ncbi:MAG: hypothetical protein ACOYN0_12815 [Phycisphaerales bacterium]
MTSSLRSDPPSAATQLNAAAGQSALTLAERARRHRFANAGVAGSLALVTLGQVATSMAQCVPPTITSQPPTSVQMAIGQGLSVSVSVDTGYTYRWQKQAVDNPSLWSNVADSAGELVGSASSTLTFLCVDSAYEGAYRCVITAPCGTATSDTAQVAATRRAHPLGWLHQGWGINEIGGQEEDSFGASVAMDGTLVVCGAPREDSMVLGPQLQASEDDESIQSGAAWVYAEDASGWGFQVMLKASNTGAGDRFGSSVAISGETIVVGAPYEDGGSAGINGVDQDDSVDGAGAVYVFTRSGSDWVQQAYVKASDPEVGAGFGTAVAISGDLMIVGAPNKDADLDGGVAAGIDAGAVYLFRRVGEQWAQEQKIVFPNVGTQPHFAYFGESVSLSGQTFVAGASGDADSGRGVNALTGNPILPDSGAAFVFVKPQSGPWGLQAALKANNAGASDLFGLSVGVSGDTLIVGSPCEDSDGSGINSPQNNRAIDLGAAYIFERTGSSWAQRAFLKPISRPKHFGWAVACDGGFVGVNPKRFSEFGIQNLASIGGEVARKRSGVWESYGLLRGPYVSGGEFEPEGVSVAINGGRAASATEVGYGSGGVHIAPLGTGRAPDLRVLSAQVIASGGSHQLRVTVKYSGTERLSSSLTGGITPQLSSVNASDLELRPPSGAPIAAALISRTARSEWIGSDQVGSVTAVYAFNAPGGTWDGADNGVFQLRIKPDEVWSLFGQQIPELHLRNYSLWFNNPAGAVDSVAVADGGFSFDAAVRYTDVAGSPLGISWGSVGNGDVELVAPGGTVIPSTLRSRLIPQTGQLLATYRFPARGGYWDWTDNGPYVLRLLSNQVWDNQGFPAPGQTLRTYNLYFNTPNALATGMSVANGGTSATATLTYRANNRMMDWSSIGDGDIELRGPDGYVGVGTLLSRTYSPSNNTYTVLYRLPARGGTWDPTDNGSYELWMRGSQVWDSLGFPLPAMQLYGYYFWF